MANRNYYRPERPQYRQDDDYHPGQYEQYQSERDYQAGEMPLGYADDIDARHIPPNGRRRRGSYMPEQGSGYGDTRNWQRREQGPQSDYDPLAHYEQPSDAYAESRRQPGVHSAFTGSSFGGESFSTPGGYSGAGTGAFFDPSADYGRRRDYRNDHERGFFEKAGDEIASWFGDDDAERRRRMDHRGRGPANYTRSNERLLEDACERLTHDRGVDARNISVAAEDNEITLDGTVNTRWEKRRAEDCVHDISGVKHVQNNLRIQETEMRAGNSPSGKEAS